MKVLMCLSPYYRVNYEINPWMKKDNQPVLDKALEQHLNLLGVYVKLGVRVEMLESVENLPDMVFTANAAAGKDGLFVLSNFRHAERRLEQEYYKRWFLDHGFDVLLLPPHIYFEGQGDFITLEEAHCFGYGIRSSIEALERIQKHLKLSKKIVSLRLVDDRFYHLDTCFMYIKPLDAILYYPAAFDYESKRRIKEFRAEKIEVTEEEALTFVCNGVYVGKTVILGSKIERIEKLLRDKGLEVVTVDVSEFKKAGGSVRCLTLFLD